MVKLNPGLIAVLLWSLASSVIWSFVNALYIRLIESAANERFLIIDVVDLFMIVAAKIEPLAAPAINFIFVAALSDADERLLAGPGLAIGTAFGALASLYLVACSAAKAIVTFLNGPNLHNSLRRFRLAIYVAEIALCLVAAAYVCLRLLAYFDVATVTRVLKYSILAFSITVVLYGLASFAAYWCVPVAKQIGSRFGFRQ